MDKDKMQAFTARVSQANRSELVVIIFDIIQDCIESAKIEFEQNNSTEYKALLKKSQLFLNELMGSLDFQYPISFELMSLYIYMNKTILEARFQDNTDGLEIVLYILNQLVVSFREVSKQDTSPAIMMNSQQIFAGLTYGRGVLTETCVSANESNRGFRA